jgi:ribonuclease Z
MRILRSIFAASLMIGALMAGGGSALAFDGIRVTLLGTGALIPSVERFGPATLIEAGNAVLLFDCGRGVAQRLGQVGVEWDEVDAVVLTHLHSDHVVGLPDLWLTALARGRPEPLLVYGPEGTVAMAQHLRQAFSADIASRHDAVPEAAAIDAHDISENVVYQTDELVVTAFVVDHGAIRPAYGYRIDYQGRRSVVLSGDTRYSDNLIRNAKGVQLLVHEVAAADAELAQNSPRVRSILDIHTTPEDAARVFRQARPYLAVYSHIVLLGVKDDEVMRRTHDAYRGPVEMGKDLMVIEIQNEVQVRSAPSEPRPPRK